MTARKTLLSLALATAFAQPALAGYRQWGCGDGNWNSICWL